MKSKFDTVTQIIGAVNHGVMTQNVIVSFQSIYGETVLLLPLLHRRHYSVGMRGCQDVIRVDVAGKLIWSRELCQVPLGFTSVAGRVLLAALLR